MELAYFLFLCGFTMQKDSVSICYFEKSNVNFNKILNSVSTVSMNDTYTCTLYMYIKREREKLKMKISFEETFCLSDTLSNIKLLSVMHSRPHTIELLSSGITAELSKEPSAESHLTSSVSQRCECQTI